MMVLIFLGVTISAENTENHEFSMESAKCHKSRITRIDDLKGQDKEKIARKVQFQFLRLNLNSLHGKNPTCLNVACEQSIEMSPLNMTGRCDRINIGTIYF